MCQKFKYILVVKVTLFYQEQLVKYFCRKIYGVSKLNATPIHSNDFPLSDISQIQCHVLTMFPNATLLQMHQRLKKGLVKKAHAR